MTTTTPDPLDAVFVITVAEYTTPSGTRKALLVDGHNAYLAHDYRIVREMTAAECFTLSQESELPETREIFRKAVNALGVLL